MNKPHFHNDLKYGQAIEAKLCALFTNLKQTDGKIGDLITPTQDKVEVKGDKYDMDKTANFFIEHYGDVMKGKLGGPWKAAADGCKYFIYFYNSNSVGYIFNTNDLLQQLSKLDLKPVEVKNVRWTTVGYKVLRSSLKPLAYWVKGELFEAESGVAREWGWTGASKSIANP